jgi:gliding motility-associated-like protein
LKRIKNTLKVLSSVFFILALSQLGYSQCGSSDFYSADTTPFCAPRLVAFTATGSPAGSSYQWDFGNGFSNTGITTSFLFKTSGKKTVRLKITYPDFTVCEIVKVGYIDVRTPPEVVVAIDSFLQCDNPHDSTKFTDNTIGSASRDYLIDGVLFTDAPNPFYYDFLTAPIRGVREAFVIVRDSFGCIAKKQFDTIAMVYDSVGININPTFTNGCAPVQNEFNASFDRLSPQHVDKYFWEFPGASPSTSNSDNPTVTYPGYGEYDVILTIQTVEGCEYTDTNIAQMTFGNVQDIKMSSTDDTVCRAQVVTHTISNFNTSYPITWDISPSTFEWIDSQQNYVTIKYNEVGPYTITLMSNIYGCITNKVFSNEIIVQGPTANVYAKERVNCIAPDTFVMSDASTYPAGGTSSNYWEIRDLSGVKKTASNKDSIDFIISSYGTYQLMLIASHSNGCKDTFVDPEYLKIDSINSGFMIDGNPYCTGEPVPFTNTTEDGSDSVPNKYKWTFYDESGTEIGNSITEFPTMSYSSIGKYDAKLLVYNDLGCQDSVTLKDTAIIELPNPTISISDSLICQGETSTLIANVASPINGLRHIWKLKNVTKNLPEKTFVGESVNYIFPSSGEYDVTYMYTTPTGGCTDTLYFPKRIKVSGGDVEILMDKTGGCLPLNVKLTARITGEENYSGSNLPYSFEWGPAKSGVTYSNPFDSVTTATYIKYSKTLHNVKYTLGSGCEGTEFTNTFVISGLLHKFGLSTYSPCIGDTFTAAINDFGTKPDIYKWMSDSPSKIEIINPNTKDAKFIVRKNGIIPITSIASIGGQCYDTFTVLLHVKSRVLEVSTADTVLFCAPTIASFDINTNYATDYFWDFGDGDTLSTFYQNIGHVYQRNSDSNGFLVTVIGEDFEGCPLIDSIRVTVIGPIADFEVTPTFGCEPLEVKFTNKSSQYSRFFLDYGDGSVLDSTKFEDHTYMVPFHPSYQVYYPELTLIDKFNCNYSYTLPDSIVVLKRPEAAFTANKTMGCSPLKVDFTNLTRFGQDYEWDFDGDGVIDSKEFNPTFKFLTEGKYVPTVIVRNANNCYDTLETTDTITVLGSPSAAFKVPLDTACAIDTIQFLNQSTGIYKLTSYEWDFGILTTLEDTSTLKNPKYVFNSPGINIINLKIEDELGCTDTAIRSIFISDTILGSPPNIKYITIENNSDIRIEWEELIVNKFGHYEVAEDNAGYDPVYTSIDPKDTSTTVTNVDVTDKAQCYSISYYDTCGYRSDYQLSHCTVLLWCSETSSTSIELNWLHYQGWGRIERYDIFRSEDNGPFELIKTVAGGIQQFVDDSLCDKNYCYYVEAVHPNLQWRSRSNNTCCKVTYDYPVASSRLIRATVIEDQFALIEWEKDTSLPILDAYVIERDGLFSYAETDKLFFIDSLANVHGKSYQYKIRLKDHCGYYSTPSNVGKTIYLEGTGGRYQSNLVWNQYREWQSGVRNYAVEIQDINGAFDTIAVVNSGIITYDDLNQRTGINDSLCYRVYAVKDSISNDTSMSNVVCIARSSVVYVPDAFTPNDDNINDIFKPFTASLFRKKGDQLRSYKFTIFNRWGEEIFTTDDPDIGWDGSFKGEQVQMGHYIYVLSAVGLDGIPHKISGVVHLIR